MEVPLLGSINHVVLSDTLKVDLPDFDDVSRAKLKIITSNDFPADVILYAQFWMYPMRLRCDCLVMMDLS